MKRIYTEDDLTGLILQEDMICKKCKKSFSSEANECKPDDQEDKEGIFTMCPHCQEVNQPFQIITRI